MTLREAGSAGAGEATAFLEALQALHQRRWEGRGQPGAFASDFARAFHRHLLAECFERGEVQLAAVFAGTHPVGHLYNFVYRGVASNYQGGFVYGDEPWRRPGLVAHALVIQHGLERGWRRYNLLMGDQQYKRSLTHQQEELVWLRLQRPRLRFAVVQTATSCIRPVGRGAVFRAAGFSLVLAVFPPPAAAAVYDATPDTYRSLLGQLHAGDTLRLAPGVYRRGLPLHGVSGTAAAPVIVEGPEGAGQAVFLARPGHNTVSLANVAHLVLRRLVLDGNGATVDAVKAEGFPACDYVHDVTLEALEIRGHGQDQQQVGISTKCPAWNWVIRGNWIVGAGTGLYLGDSNGEAPFVRGLIEGNVVTDSIGYNLQIKHQIAWTEVIPHDLPRPAVTVIRNNFFGKAAGSASGNAARPNVLLGHFPRAGAGLEAEYQVYGNVFHANPHEALLQGEGNLAVYRNLFVNPLRSAFPAIAIQPHNDVPRRIRIEHNTIVSAGPAIAVRGTAPGCQPVIARNAVFAEETRR